MIGYHARFQQLLSDGVPFVAVTVVHTIGSVPQDQGAKILVTEAGLDLGSVGGGRVEARAIAEARALLEKRTEAPRTLFVDWNLKRDVGMTCGGSVKLYFELFNVPGWEIAIFGAGHVANSLARVLAELDCRATFFDTRPEWLARLPDSPRIRRVLSEDLPGEVSRLPENAFVVLMTMGHATDRPILIEILRDRNFPFVGVIGSVAKARRLQKDLVEAGLPPTAEFHCPVGLKLGTNHPGEIAVSIAAQIIQERDRISSAQTPSPGTAPS